MMTESGGRNLVGKAGERGPMQIMPSTAMQYGVTPEQLDDPTTNRALGERILSRLLTKYNGDISKTLAAYNAGEGAVDRGQVPESTRRYVSNVLARTGHELPPSQQIASAPQGAMPGAARLLPILAQMQAAWAPSQAQAAQSPFDLQQQQQQPTPLGAGAGFHPAFAEPGMQPNAVRPDVNYLLRMLGMPHQALRAVAQPQYRTLISGTPWQMTNQPPYSTAPPWIRRNLPGLAGLDRSGRPLYGRQNLQRGADIAADVGTGVFESQIPLERLLGASQPLEGTILGKTSDMADAEREAARARNIEQWGQTPQGRDLLQDVRDARVDLARNRALREQDMTDFVRQMRITDPDLYEQFSRLPPERQYEIASRAVTGIPMSNMDEFADATRSQNALRFRQLSRQGLPAALTIRRDLQQQQAQPTPTPTTTPSLLERLKAAWAPGTAQAAEGPPTEAQIAQDKARRRAAAPKDEANAPWPVRAAGWAPLIGQTIGEYGMGAADIGTTGPAAIATEPIAQGIGGGAGYGAGEMVNRGVRSLYGYPNPTWSQEAKDTGVAAGTSAVAVPIWRLAGKALPASLKVGIKATREARPGVRAATEAVEDVGARIANTPRRAVATMITKAGEGVTSGYEKLLRMRQVIAKLPEDMISRAYNMSRAELAQIIDKTLAENERWLKRPDLQTALKDTVREAVNKTPYTVRKYVEHHLGWIGFRALFNPAVALYDAFIAGGYIAASRILNSPIMRRMYVGLLSAQTPHAVRLLGRAMLNSYVTDLINAPPEQQQEEPSAAPAPAAAATPSAPRAAGLPPAVPGTGNVQEIEPAEQPPQEPDMPTWMETE